MPLSEFFKDRHATVTAKTTHRIVGCVLGRGFGNVMLCITSYSVALGWIALPAGVWIGQHIQSGKEDIDYFGGQFSLGYLTAFVHNPCLEASWHAPIERLLSTVTGLLLLGVVLVLSARLHRPRSGPGPA